MKTENTISNFDTDLLLVKDRKRLVHSKKQRLVRTSFTLSQQTHVLLRELVEKYNFKTGEIFDTILSIQDKKGPFSRVVIKFIKNNKDLQLIEPKKKSFAIKEKNLNRLNKIAKEEEVHRNLIVDISIILIHKILYNIYKTEQKKMKKALDLYYLALEKTENIHSMLGKEIGSDEDLTWAFGEVTIVIQNFISDIEHCLNTNTIFTY